MSATDGTSSASMTIRELSATLDLAANRISGSAPGANPGWIVTVDISKTWEDPSIDYVEATVQGDGTFSFDLSVDLVKGDKIFITLYEGDQADTTFNLTNIAPYNDIPALGGNVDGNWIRGEMFPPDTDITVTINGGAKGSFNSQSDGGGYFSLELWQSNIDIVAGDRSRPASVVNAIPSHFRIFRHLLIRTITPLPVRPPVLLANRSRFRFTLKIGGRRFMRPTRRWQETALLSFR